jgi:hypothetical protein
MGKRKSDKQISKSEIKLSGQHHYDGYIKKPSRINPIFTRVPDYRN